MGHPPFRLPRAVLGTVLGAGLVAAPLTLVPLAAQPALASPDGQNLVINEAYLKGGSANAPFKNKFVELYNPSSSAVDLSQVSLQYRSADGTGAANGSVTLTGSIKAKGYYLIALPGNSGGTGAELPTPDLSTNALTPSGAKGTLYLAKGTAKLTLPTGHVTQASAPEVIDLFGYGVSNTFEGAARSTNGSNATPDSLQRSDFADTDNNAADLAESGTITPQNAQGSTTDPEPTPTPEPTPDPEGSTPIREIQGEGAESPLAGKTVTTTGRVTAAYPSGGFAGFYLQTPGTGGKLSLDTHRASDAVFVYSKETVGQVKVGDYVQVTGAVSEYQGQTQLTVAKDKTKVLPDDGVGTVAPAEVAFPSTDGARESLEGMLLAPQGEYTVTDNYDANYYGQLGLVTGTTPLLNPTVKGLPGTAAYEAEVKRAKEGAVALDDGSSVNFNSNANKSLPLPYLSTSAPVRVGAKVSFTKNVILEFRNNEWKFQPTSQLTPANAAQVQPATFANTREAAPKDVGGDIRLAGFNVLNYFTTLGADTAGCVAYTDRAGAGVTVKEGCKPRGAWDKAAFERQQGKIVEAINTLGANVVSLEEIENSKTVDGHDRDEALAALVKALNAADSKRDGDWDYVRSPQQLPVNEDVIRTAFIYKKDSIETVGESAILTDSDAFKNARQPLAQHFRAKGTDTEFLAIVNHFKSKGDSAGTAAGDNVDKKDGIGAYNGDRKRQAEDLVKFAKAQQASAKTDNVFLIGDFNSYAAEDPITTIEAAGFKNQGAKSGEETYAFGGAIGSLDYVFASPSADALVTGVDEWNINSVESVALEYSRYNYNALDLFAAGPFRSSDHDPVVVGLKTADTLPADTKRLNLLNINDFHGRIDANTVKFAGTVESLKAQHPDSSLFLSAGDNIGASLFASSVQQDKPTLDVLNALGLAASATGNHEYDQGADDLTGRVSDAADFAYLAANVTKDGKPILDEYKIVDVDGVKVGLIGAITQETPTLVSPGGIQGLEFSDPVDAVNRVAAQLSDGDAANGEADVLVAEYHEGTSAGVSTGDTLETALSQGGIFKKIAEGTSEKVDVIFNGHTHAEYAYNVPVPGGEGTRPVLQTGSYGENIGQVVLDYNTKTGATSTVTNHNVERLTTADDELVGTYPAAAEVKAITDAALAKAAEVGSQKIGAASAPITTAMKEGKRDDRGSESTLGNFVADAMLSKLSSADRGAAEIGVVNPGGLRSDIDKGDVTYAQANAVLPFLNNLWTTTLTGEQFKKVLEQQWQRDKDGNVPSRPYLQLGLSKNVTYTYDEKRPEGDRITSVTVSGAPLDPQREYRIGSFSFLLQGGDNFREFESGKDTKDSGLVDRDAWIDYIKEAGTISPSYERRAIAVSGLPTEDLEPGKSYELTFTKLDLTSTDVPPVTRLDADPVAAPAQARAALTRSTTAVAAAAGQGTYGSAEAADGAATLTVSIPKDAADGTKVAVTAQPTGTSLTLPTAVKAEAGTGSDAGSDADADGGQDAGSDGGSDTGADGSAEAGVDGGSDAGAAGGQDAGSDAGAGAEADAGADGSGAGADGSDSDQEAAAEGDDASSGTDNDADAQAGAGTDGSGAAGTGSDGGDAGVPEAGEQPDLPETGATVGGWILGGSLALLAGVGALIAARARRGEHV